jgi:plasmid stabilization system protein ParE
MSAFLLSPEADEDVWNIWRYLAEETGVSVANRIEAELFNAFETLARTPGIGHRRADLTGHPVFFFTVYQYMIVYRKSQPLEVAAVLHGKRDMERILARRNLRA